MAHRKRRNVSRAESKRIDPLIAPGGKVDPAAIYRAATAGLVPSRPPEAVSIAHDDLDEHPDGDDDGTILAAMPPARQRVSFTLTRDLDKRLDKYLVDRITFLSRNKLQELIDAGRVSVNGKPGKASTKLRLGDVVEAHIDAPPSEDYPPQDIPLDVLYEDEHMIVLNKSPDIIVHPARTHTQGTMINALAYHFRHRSPCGGSLSGVGGEFARPGVVHRLDRQTSGVIVFAKSDTAHWKLAEQFENRTTDKRYVAIVHGRVEPLVDVIDVPIGPHPSREKGFREKQVVRHDHLGKPAVSVYRVLGRYMLEGEASATLAPVRSKPRGWGSSKPSIADGASLRSTSSASDTGRNSPFISVVEVELKTGRTHQIRVHFQHRFHPLVGDDMYEGRSLEIAGMAVSRVALHAAMLKIKHPITGKGMVLIAPFPSDLRAPLKALRSGTGGNQAEEFPSPPGAVLTLDDLTA